VLLFGMYTFSEDPPIFSIPDIDRPEFMSLIPPSLKPQLLPFPMWTKEPYSEIMQYSWRLRKTSKQQFAWMRSTELEARRLARFGYRAVWCNHDCYCNETIFKIIPVEKKYDAIHTAVIQPSEWVELAAGVKSLRLATRTPNMRRQLEKLGLGHARCNATRVAGDKVAQAINESCCGLALSKREGSMFACTEY
jgi:hypothetical protein